MKQSIKTFLLLLILSVTLASNANETYSYTFRFNESDFIFTQVSSDSIIIASKNEPQYYEESAYPAIPFIGRSIGVPIAQIPVISSVEVYTREVQNHIVLAKAPRPMATNGLPVQKTLSDYNMKVYPDTIWDMDTPKTDGSVSLFRFVITPFKYDAVNQTLAFVDSVKFEFSTSCSADMNSVCNTVSPTTLNLALQHIENKEEISASSSFISAPLNNNDNTVDYLIVTADVFKDSYKPLLDWKRTKGLRAQMITVETIDSLITGSSRLLRIKKYLERLSKTKRLKYALLAGDSCHIPVRLCKTRNIKYPNEKRFATYNFSPSDLFYACFEGAYDWDGNKNGIYGETNDNIDFNPSIVVTRIPSLKKEEADIMVKRIIEYEKSPKWNNNMLIGGTWLSQKKPTVPTNSDADKLGDLLFKTSISPYWSGSVKAFFDTRTDFEGNADYDFSIDHFQDQLSTGYSFVSIITHGSPQAWRMEDKDGLLSLYDRTIAQKLQNPYHTIITTMACYTNYFDYVPSDTLSEEPCLCESFLRNPNSGVVAYLGSSREGWFTDSNTLGPSLSYESEFYKHLFSNDLKTLSFGTLVAQSKLGLTNFCWFDNAYRNIQFSLNPIGDPEMPIFTTSPKAVETFEIKVINDTVLIGSPQPDLKTTLTENSSERPIIAEGYDVLTLSLEKLPEEVTVCLTGRNYIPYVLNGYIAKESDLSNIQLNNYDFIIVGGNGTNSNFLINGTSSMQSPLIIFTSDFSIDNSSNLFINN